VLVVVLAHFTMGEQQHCPEAVAQAAVGLVQLVLARTRRLLVLAAVAAGKARTVATASKV
jgi:hypothetical protein